VLKFSAPIKSYTASFEVIKLLMQASKPKAHAVLPVYLRVAWFQPQRSSPGCQPFACNSSAKWRTCLFKVSF